MHEKTGYFFYVLIGCRNDMPVFTIPNNKDAIYTWLMFGYLQVFGVMILNLIICS